MVGPPVLCVAVFLKLLSAHSCSWKTPLSLGNKLQVQRSKQLRLGEKVGGRGGQDSR